MCGICPFGAQITQDGSGGDAVAVMQVADLRWVIQLRRERRATDYYQSSTNSGGWYHIA